MKIPARRLAPFAAAVLLAMAPAAQAEADEKPADAAQALERLATRIERIRNIEVAYREISDSDTPGAGVARSTLDFMGKIDATSSAGWALAVSRSLEQTRASLLEFSSATLTIHELSPKPRQGWTPTRNPIVMEEVSRPIEYCVSFFHREFFPSAKPADARPAQLLARVDGRDERLNATALRDAKSSMTIVLDEPGILSYRGQSQHMLVDEQTQEFTREAHLGLVPKRRVIRTEEPAGTRKTARFELKKLRVNDPRFSLGEADTSAALLSRLAP